MWESVGTLAGRLVKRGMDDVEPIPETREALRRLSEPPMEDLGPDLQEAGTILQARVPGLVAFSISIVRENLTFTYVASAFRRRWTWTRCSISTVGRASRPSRRSGSWQSTTADLFDEGRWQFFARAGNAYGIASTLSIPIIHDDEVVGGVNVYGAAGDTFDGRHDELARLFGAWAPGAVTNADLLFTSRLEALRAVDRLRGHGHRRRRRRAALRRRSTAPLSAGARRSGARCCTGGHLPRAGRASCGAWRDGAPMTPTSSAVGAPPPRLAGLRDCPEGCADVPPKRTEGRAGAGGR